MGASAGPGEWGGVHSNISAASLPRRPWRRVLAEDPPVLHHLVAALAHVTAAGGLNPQAGFQKLAFHGHHTFGVGRAAGPLFGAAEGGRVGLETGAFAAEVLAQEPIGHAVAKLLEGLVAIGPAGAFNALGPA